MPTETVFFAVQVPFAEITTKTLCFAIYDFDRFSKHDQIGQVLIPLNTIDLGQVIEEWRDISCPPDDKEAVSWSHRICESWIWIWPLFLGKPFGRYMLFIEICSYSWKADCCHFGGQKLEKNGRWWFIRWRKMCTLLKLCAHKINPLLFRSVRENCLVASWKEIKKEKDEYQKMYTESVLQWVFFVRSSIRTNPGEFYKTNFPLRKFWNIKLQDFNFFIEGTAGYNGHGLRSHGF